MGKFLLRMDPHAVQQALRGIEKQYQSFVPGHPFQYAFTAEINQAAYDKESRWKAIIGFGAGLSIFISGIGLFALSLLITRRRAKEIAIRKVLGATNRGLLIFLSADLGKLVLLGFLIASPLGTIAIDKWLGNFAYRAAFSWTLFALTAALVLAVALLTTIFHSARAATANPALSLKQA